MNPTTLNEGLILETLRQVFDPEIDCNIIDLGLVSGIVIEGGNVTVRMTLTTPGCPMQESIARGVQAALLSLDGVEQAEVQLVWDPPWTPARMSDYARAHLGISD